MDKLQKLLDIATHNKEQIHISILAAYEDGHAENNNFLKLGHNGQPLVNDAQLMALRASRNAWNQIIQHIKSEM